jgi:hypothetical protein
MRKLEDFKISENLKYHLDNGLSLSETIFRIGSDAHIDLINEVRDLWEKGKIILEGRDEAIAKLKTGKPAIYKGKKVKLHLPEYENTAGKKLKVYLETDEKDKETGLPIAKILRFGDPERTIKNHDEKAADSFQARHQCDAKTDINTAGFWSCNIHIFHKELSLKSSYPW